MSVLHESVQFIRSVVSLVLGWIHILYRAVRTIIFVIKQKEIVYKGIIMDGKHTPVECLDRVCNMTLKSDDVIILGYPKSGTTWLQEIVWLLMNNNTSGEEYRSSIWDRVPLVEQHTPGQPPAIDLVEQMSSPRLFKSHLPTWAFEEQLTHSKCRAIVIMRNPKDSLVSYYHMAKNVAPYLPVTWNIIFKRFRQGKMYYGDWFDYVEGWSKMADREHVLFLKYEDMKADITSSIKTICTFLGLTPDDEVVKSIVERTTFKNMQKNPYTNMENNVSLPGMKNFIRKGEIGGWVEYFTPEQNEYMDNLIATRLNGTGLDFKYT